MQEELIQLEKLNRSFGNGRSPIAYADSLSEILVENGMDNCEAFFLIALKKGESYELAFDYEIALEHYYKLLEFTEKFGFYKIKIETYIAIARIHEMLKRDLDCKRNLETAKKLMDEYQEYSSMGHYAVRYSSYSRYYGNVDTAIHYAKIAIKLGKNSTHNRTELDGNLLMGTLINDIQTRIPYFNKAIELYLENKSYYGASIQTWNIAKSLIKEGRFEDANTYLDQALDYAYNMSEKDARYYFIFYTIYKEKQYYFLNKNNIDSAYYYANLSHQNEIKSIRTTDQEIIDQIEIKQAVDKEKNKVVFLEKQRSYLEWTILIGSGIIFLLARLIIKNIKNRKRIDDQTQTINFKNKELEKSISKQSTLLTEIHHRVKNNLQMIMSLLILQGQKAGNTGLQSEFNDIADKVRSVALIHDQLYQDGEFDTINLQSYFSELFKHFNHLKQFDFEISVNDISLNLETVMPLGIITSELINNSIKYVTNKNDEILLNLSLEKDNDDLTLVYKDNGNGYTKDNLKDSKQGMGSMLIFSMERQLNGQSNTYNQNGAIFELKFKEKRVSGI